MGLILVPQKNKKFHEMETENRMDREQVGCRTGWTENRMDGEQEGWKTLRTGYSKQ